VRTRWRPPTSLASCCIWPRFERPLELLVHGRAHLVDLLGVILLQFLQTQIDRVRQFARLMHDLFELTAENLGDFA
jgi:hypothetical protein